MSGDVQFIAAADMDIRKLKCGRSKSGRVKREYADFDPKSPDFKDPLTRSKRVKKCCEKLYVSLQQSKAQVYVLRRIYQRSELSVCAVPTF